MDDRSIHGYTIVGKWVNGTRGVVAYATKNGKKYSLKKYTNYISPTYDGMYDEKTLRIKKEEFNSFVETRMKIIDKLSSVRSCADNIIFPFEGFVEGSFYYEAIEAFDTVVCNGEADEMSKSLTNNQIKTIMISLAKAVTDIHSTETIIGTLTNDSVVFVRNESGIVLPKLIAFEECFFVNELYCSPELAEYSDCEDEEERLELIKKITYKTDIFSLGVVFHYYLSGEFPQAVKLTERMERRKIVKERAGRTAVFYPHVIVSNGCELKLSDKITSVNVRMLLLDMMNGDPDKRPTAMQVLSKLKTIS